MLYMQGQKICVIGAPLVHGDVTVGVIVLDVFDTDLKGHWHMTEKEFEELDFS